MAKQKLYLVKTKSGKVKIVKTSKNDYFDGFRIPKDFKVRRETEPTRKKGKTGNKSGHDFSIPQKYSIPQAYKERKEITTDPRGEAGKQRDEFKFWDIFTIPKETTEMTTKITTELTTEIRKYIPTKFTREIRTEIKTDLTTEITIEIPTKFTTKITTEITTEPTTEPIGKRNECACGKQFLSRNKRGEMERNEIAGGEDTVPREFPWLVRIVGGCAGG